MGFFSWNCKWCGESIKSPYACEHKMWQNDCVLVKKSGTTVIGEYDGYGRIRGEGDEYEIRGEPELWHYPCWIKAGKPKFSGASDGAQDQGFFVDCAECKAYAEKFPHRFSKGEYSSHELRCHRVERAQLDRVHPEWAKTLHALEGADTRWYCEESDCPHHGQGETCNAPGDSEKPLMEEGYDATAVVR